MGTNRPGEIFDGQSIWDFITLRRKDLHAHIDKVDVYSVDNIQEWKDNLYESFYIAPLHLEEPQIGEPFETVVSVQTSSGYRNIDTTAVKVEIPVSGFVRLFEKSPNSGYMVFLNQKYTLVEENSRSGWLTTTFHLEEMSADLFKTRMGKFIKDVSLNIPEMNANVATWNDSLLSEIESAISSKKSKLDKKHDFMREIGLNINQRSSEYLIPPIIQKKAIPTPESKVKTKNVSILPTLRQGVYADILKVLASVGGAFERKPSLYENKDEEDLRDIFLLFLETRYENTSGHGEAFNRKGKTDILLKYAPDGSNLFVAECKIWTGEKGLHSAIDQLLSYLTHRDSKTALLMFVKNKNFNSLVRPAENAIKAHSNFKGEIQHTSPTSFACTFSLPEDEMSRIQLEVMLFHFP